MAGLSMVLINAFNTGSTAFLFQISICTSTPRAIIFLILLALSLSLPPTPHLLKTQLSLFSYNSLSSTFFSLIHSSLMGIHPCIARTPREEHLFLSILLLLIFTPARYLAQGRPLFHLMEVIEEEKGQEMAMVGALIGSRPPSCERRCLSCGHCEPVQVPAVPQDKNGIGYSSRAITSRGDDSSNYKPLSWKCKCGHRILNP
ncbi:EPIDERMAL PATTERNING FACTOR-like protein 2 [Elaeis guineensis]|uniref:EPIDERMAL PATTERNING FACTOR-like protein 2 n=1 Tax=Elaeis guineensis var. tenera TaxID=51953 RepID=UPI003C6D6105